MFDKLKELKATIQQIEVIKSTLEKGETTLDEVKVKLQPALNEVKDVLDSVADDVANKYNNVKDNIQYVDGKLVLDVEGIKSAFVDTSELNEADGATPPPQQKEEKPTDLKR